MSVEQAREWLQEVNSVAVLTGAGISAESGVPTFRGSGGLWRTYRAEDLATPEAFARDPKLVWEWYNWRREVISKVKPNPAHYALVRLEAAKRDFTLITQNIDGLHDLAGSGRLLKLHGDLWRLRCMECGSNWPDRRASLPKLPPHCGCGGLARPAIVWFGEALPDGMMQEAEHAVRNAGVLLVIGTSAVVYPAAGLIPTARQAGARIIEINPEPTNLADCTLAGPAGEILPQIVS